MTIEGSARALVGVKWKHQGRDPRIGVDCAGLVKIALEANGYVIRDRSDYGTDPDGSLTAEVTRVLGPPVATSGGDLQPCDVVLMQFAPNRPRHVGIIGSHAQGATLIHAYNLGPKRVVEVLLDARWRAYIIGVWRPE